MIRFVQVLVALVAITATRFALSENPSVAVVYPELREPFAAIYRDYIVGIDDAIDGELKVYPYNGNGVDQLRKSVDDDRHGVYISLGNKSTQLVRDLKPGRPIVAAVTSPDYESSVSAGILLRPSAAVYLDSLFEVVPEAGRVFTVYNPKVDQELIDEAAAFLEARDIAFEAVPAGDIREAAEGFRSIVSYASHYDAIWLMADKTIFDSTLLSMILDAAWEKKLAVFSSNPVYVKHGALFAIYPDNKGVGKSLGLMAAALSTNDATGLAPLKDVRLAMNERTRNHLGLTLSATTRDRVDLMLPGN